MKPCQILENESRTFVGVAATLATFDTKILGINRNLFSYIKERSKIYNCQLTLLWLFLNLQTLPGKLRRRNQLLFAFRNFWNFQRGFWNFWHVYCWKNFGVWESASQIRVKGVSKQVATRVSKIFDMCKNSVINFCRKKIVLRTKKTLKWVL